MTSLVRMPSWVLKELSTLIFTFFWSGKSSLLGGFFVVDNKSKVWSLLSQWVKRFASSPSGWVSFTSFWFRSCFDASPFWVFSSPFSFSPSVLPPFYRSLLIAWRGLDGSFSLSRNSLVFGSLSPHFCVPVSGMSTNSCYLYLLSENVVQPHCVVKFASRFGDLCWPDTWRALHFFDLDRQAIDLSWKISHGVLHTALRLFSFGLPVSLPRFCGSPVESLKHLFFSCPLAQSVLS